MTDHLSHKVPTDKSLQMVRDMCRINVEDMLMSPLSANTDDMIVVTLPPLEFSYFDALPGKLKLQNNGLTVTLNGLWATDGQPSITGANLDGKYNFSHLHFHWTDDNGGDVVNEHIVNGRGHALEMHLIFFKGSCRTIFEAESIQNGLVTLVYFFDVTENQHLGIDHITSNLKNILTFGQMAKIPVFPLGHLVQNQPGEYFTYSGKINKRGCQCGVTQWIIFTKTCGVNREQIDQFRCLLNKRGHAIRRNYRKSNPVPAGNTAAACPYLVLDVRRSQSADNNVPAAAAATRSWQPSKRRSLTKIASTGGSGKSEWPLCVKPNKTQLLRRSFNLQKKLPANNNHRPPNTNNAVVTNSGLRIAKGAAAATAKTENHLRPTVSKPSWK